jgi:hypothetical protein
MKIKGKYQITYQNGFKQEKYLIEHQDYLNVVKPLDSAIGHLELFKKTEDDVSRIKTVLKELFSADYFTDESPIFKAIKTGILDLPLGKTNIKVIRL